MTEWLHIDAGTCCAITTASGHLMHGPFRALTVFDPNEDVAYIPVGGDDETEATRRAVLIAAAPELLVLCGRLLDAARRVEGQSPLVARAERVLERIDGPSGRIRNNA